MQKHLRHFPLRGGEHLLILASGGTGTGTEFCRSNIVGDLLPWDGNDWEMTSEVEQDEYQVHNFLLPLSQL